MQSDLRDIIWLQTAFIGDVVLTSGAIELAARSFPGVRQHVISTAAGCEVLKGSPFLVERIPFAKRESFWPALKEVKKRLQKARVKADTAVILQVHRSLRSSLLSRYLGIRTITYDETVFGFLADKRVKRDRSVHEAVRVASLLSALGVSASEINSVRPVLQALPLRSEIPWQKEFSEFSGKCVALAVGSQWGTKRWPLESYLELAERLFSIPDLAIALMGSSEERALTDVLARTLQEKFPTRTLWNLAGQTSFDDLRRVFPKLNLIVSNDSSPVHFASAFNVPTLAIFGPTVPAFGFGPLSDKHAIAEHLNLPCRPCSDHGPQVCPLGHFKCMKELSVQTVFEKALKLLG